MEMDDSVNSSAIDDADETSSSKENGGRLSRHSQQGTVQKDEVTVQTQEDPPGSSPTLDMDIEMGMGRAESVKLPRKIIKMNDDEQEGSRASFVGKKKASIASSNQNSSRIISEKRSHRRSASYSIGSVDTDFDEPDMDDLLVGFDENGEGVFIKDEDGSLIKRFKEQEEAFEKSRIEELQRSSLVQTPPEPMRKKFRKSSSSGMSSKKSPSKSPAATGSLMQWKSPAASPLPRKSPAASSPIHSVSSQKTSPAASAASGASPSPICNSPKKQEKLHIVADSEEHTNGNVEEEKSFSKPQATVAPVMVDDKKATSNDFLLPFKYGWKRELVWRANLETSKDKADVYYITPSGKKLRTRGDIMHYLKGELTLDNFSFAKEPLGVEPEFETVRSAKPINRLSVTPTTPVVPSPPMGKRISKPKGPKGASPPPQGWTPTSALKVNNMLLSGRQPPSLSSNRTTPGTNAKSSKAKKQQATPGAESSSKQGVGSMKAHEPCTMMCARATGQVPQLKCAKCLCMYHHECVGLSRKNNEYRLAGDAKPADSKKRDYICEACKPSAVSAGAITPTATPTPIPPPTAVTAMATAKTPLRSPAGATSASPSLSAQSTPVSRGGGVTAGKQQAVVKPAAKVHSLPTARLSVPAQGQRPPASNRPTQTVGVFKSKKYLMSHRPIPYPKAKPNDVINDLKHMSDTFQNKKKDLRSIKLDDAPKPDPSGYNDMQKVFCFNFFSNIASAYDVIVTIFKYLKIHERSRAASVCKLWNLVAKDTSLWRVVRMKNSKVCNWQVFAHTLRRGETKHLDLRKMLIQGGRSDEMWLDFCKHIGLVDTLEVIDLCRCSTRVLESLFESNSHLRTINALATAGDSLNLDAVRNMESLQELRLRMCDGGTLTMNLEPLTALGQLKHLSLTGIRSLSTDSIKCLGEMRGLRSLELGECGHFDSTLALAVLPKLSNLQRLRLENGQEVSCCTLEIVDAVARLEKLTQLELVNFDIKPGFDDKLQLCTNIRKLLIIPTYISQSATTNHIMLSAVQRVADTLHVLTWGVTVELLRVTALYVDQCEEAKKKRDHNFNESIPVLKPVPGAPLDESEENDENADDANSAKKSNEENDVPQIEILPLYKVESILHENLPKTRYTIVKLPYHATCKQQLVE